jgi:gliding motility-associated lipoprotein GldD
MLKIVKNKVLFALLLLLATACTEEAVYLPKPVGFHRIELPEPQYQLLEGDYPYQFEYSRYAKIKPYKTSHAQPYWIEIDYDSITISSIHISFHRIENDPQRFKEYVNDAYKMTFNPLITARATAIDQKVDTLNGNTVFFTFSEGEVPTVFNYWISDSTQNFFRAALYVPSSRDNDSLAPILKYTQNDMMHLLKTFRWKETKSKKN